MQLFVSILLPPHPYFTSGWVKNSEYLILMKLDISSNLRMCGDCHAATALISKILQRIIVVRDAKIFHKLAEILENFKLEL